MSERELWLTVARALHLILAAIEARHPPDKRAERQTWWDSGLPRERQPGRSAGGHAV